MRRRVVLLDTSFVVALENRDDPLHERAKQIDRRLTEDDAILLLHWGILLEIGDGYARLNRREKGCELLDRFRHESGYEVVSFTEALADEAAALYVQRRDKEWGLTDCISFVLMRERDISDALTSDVHFRQAGFNAMLLS